MIVTDHDHGSTRQPASDTEAASTAIPPGLPAAASCGRRALPSGESLELLSVPRTDADGTRPAAAGGEGAGIADEIRGWVAATTSPATPVVFVPLYGCEVAWTASRAAVIGPPERLGQLEHAVLEFAGVEARLRAAERRATGLLEAVEGDVAASLTLDGQVPDRRVELAARHRDAVAVAHCLALLAPAVHAPPLHPPTLASQLGERLRERTRLAERHDFATHRADLAERVAEACGQRALEVGIARRQQGLEWMIVILLVVQTVLLVVELLTQRATP